MQLLNTAATRHKATICAKFTCKRAPSYMYSVEPFNSYVIKRVNYVVEQGARVDVTNDATIIMYLGTQCHTLHLIALSFYLKL